MTSRKKEDPISDRIQLLHEIAPGKHLVKRRRGETVTLGVVQKMEEGKPIKEDAELVYVDDPDTDGWHPTTVVFRGGPAQVATPAYREGYDRIFGGKQKTVEA